MPNPIFKLKKYQFLRSEKPISERRFYGVLSAKIKPKKRRIRLLGDSLSDQGKKYNETIFCIPYRYFLPVAERDQFTNGFVWVEYFKDALLSKRDQQAKGLRNRHLPSIGNNSGKFLINEAEGGATACESLRA